MKNIFDEVKILNISEEQKEYLEKIKKEFTESKFQYDESNFFCGTIANFNEVRNEEILNRMLNNQVDFESDSSSRYIYTEAGVYRYSNHWNCRVASCSWLLDNTEISNQYKLGFCEWKNFVPNNLHIIVYSKNKALLEKYVDIEGCNFSNKFYGVLQNYWKYLQHNKIGFYVEIEKEQLYNLNQEYCESMTI